ncbi:MAG: hypothetical protein AABY15_00325 [Nanoarchaeota archaeon]
MKKLLEKYKAWKLEKIRAWGQWYAGFIMNRLNESRSDWEFDFWLYKGYDLDMLMIHKYNIFLD